VPGGLSVGVSGGVSVGVWGSVTGFVWLCLRMFLVSESLLFVLVYVFGCFGVCQDVC
jgi:hypothetical protein